MNTNHFKNFTKNAKSNLAVSVMTFVVSLVIFVFLFLQYFKNVDFGTYCFGLITGAFFLFLFTCATVNFQLDRTWTPLMDTYIIGTVVFLAFLNMNILIVSALFLGKDTDLLVSAYLGGSMAFIFSSLLVFLLGFIFSCSQKTILKKNPSKSLPKEAKILKKELNLSRETVNNLILLGGSRELTKKLAKDVKECNLLEDKDIVVLYHLSESFSELIKTAPNYENLVNKMYEVYEQLVVNHAEKVLAHRELESTIANEINDEIFREFQSINKERL